MARIGRGGIEALLALMDEAFDGGGIEASNESQALLTNLATVADDQWRARPPGVTRTIESIALHVGACKVMYDDYAFGAGTLRFGTPEVEPWGADGPAPMDEVRAWLRGCAGEAAGARRGAVRRRRARPTASDELGRASVRRAGSSPR